MLDGERKEELKSRWGEKEEPSSKTKDEPKSKMKTKKVQTSRKQKIQAYCATSALTALTALAENG